MKDIFIGFLDGLIQDLNELKTAVSMNDLSLERLAEYRHNLIMIKRTIDTDILTAWYEKYTYDLERKVREKEE